MSGPWEDFKASSTEAGPWDEFTPKEQPTEKGMRTERVQQFYKDVGGGALETIGAVGSNMLLAPIAGLAGLTSLPDGLDAAVSTMGKVFDLGYQPKTDVGKAGAENVSNVLNLPAEYGGKLGEAVAGNEGRLVGEIAGEFATDLLPLGALKRGKGKAKAPEAPKLDTIEKRLEAMVKRDPSNPAVGQMELFPDTLTDTTGYASPYDASTVGTTEPIAPKRARRQQELQLDQREMLPVDAEGNVGNIDLGTKTAMEQQRLALERELDATQPIEGLKATEAEGGQQALFDIDESARMPNPTEAVTGDWRIDENGIPVKADLSMEAANLENAAQRNLWGDELPPKHEQELANTSILDNFKNSSISNKGLGRQRGAFNPEVFTFGMRAVTKKLSALTDRLANDPTWMAGIRKAFNGTEPLKNKDGTPVVLLHGTTADIKGNVRGMEQGFHAGYGPDSHFFVQNAGKEGSKAYLDPSNQRTNGQMYPVVIKGGNYPKLNADAGNWSPKEILHPNRDSAKPIRDYIRNALGRAGYTESQIDGFFRYVENQRGMAATNQAFTDVLKRAGIDGFFYTNKKESPKGGKLFNLFNRDDVPTRQKIVSQQANHPESFVTWDNKNFKSVYEAPSTPNQSRMEKPIGQRGFANKQTGAIDVKAISDTYDALKRGVATRMDYFRAWKGAFDARAMSAIEDDLRDPKSRSTLVLMRPDSFHNLALKRDDMVDAPRLHSNIEQGLESEKGLREIPQLWTDTGPDGVAQVTGHEGRHRMDVFKKMGIEAVPVIIRDSGYRWGGTDPYAGPRPTKIRPEGGLGKGAKILDFPAKTYHDYIQEAPAAVDRTTKPIGQRGFANSQTGAIDFKGFMDDATKLARTVSQMLPKANDILTLKANPHARGQLADERKFIVKRVFQDERGNWKVNGEMYDSKGEEITRFKTSAHPQEKDGFQFEHVNDHDVPLLNFNETKEVAKILEGRRDPFKGPGKSQAGAIRLPFGKKPAVDQLKKIEGIKNDPQMRNIFPEKLSVEEIIKEHAALKTPDVDQRWIKRWDNFITRGVNQMPLAFNHLTKGSLYQAIKTDNPIVRVVGEKIRQANNYAMEATGRLVHDGLAPLAQKLSKKEKADVWAVQQMAEAKGVELTPEFLREEGFNQKQIDWVTEHKAVMDDMYSRMSDSMRAAGLEPVSPRVAYVASRARGDFRRLIMKDSFDKSGKPVQQVVGIMGDNTRMGLNKQIERLKAEHPEYKIGEERYYGGRATKGTEEGFMQMLDFLSKDNPDFKLFVNHVNDMLSQDAFQYMNAKSHTMQKKRIEGMEGRKLYADAVKNAEEGMQAQIRYAETMIKWSELSKAIAEIKPLLRQDNGLDMPNAKEWANEYIQGALGNSPGKLGDALDSVTAAIGKGTGIGTTIPARAVSAMKSYVNGVLLGFGNVGFLTANALQLPRTMPEMAAWLNTKGIEAGYDLGLGRALISVQKQLFNSKLTDLERGAFEYAKKNHVYSSNLFESGNTVSKGLSYYWQKGTQMIASPLERETRKVAFFAYVHMLDEAGIKPSDGLYEAAQNLTDMHMNNYAQAEAPRIYQETGGIGRSAYNLMSFKHNELSRLAMFAREIPNGQGKPILTAMASQVAFAGLIGTLGFAEADAMYEWLTAKMGEPTSLTKILLDNPEIPDALKFGMGSLANVDLTNRMGLQLTPGSMIDLVAPGFGKLGDIGGAVGEMVSQPNLYNAANVAREALPLSVGGIMDRTVFEKTDKEGNTLAINRNKVSASAVRNDADKLWKALGMTGVNESVQKKLSYENQKIDQVYKDKRSKVIDGAIKEYYMRGVMPDNWVERYIELQGDPKEAKAAIQARIEALNVDRPTKELMQNAASKSISSQHKLLRRLGME